MDSILNMIFIFIIGTHSSSVKRNLSIVGLT